MSTPDGLDAHSFASPAELERWLEGEHARCSGIWVVIARKGADRASVSYAEVVETVLCFGWIDGAKGAIDERRWIQRITPRRARSRWSKVNRAKAEALIDAGRVRPAGLAQVEAARADGRWDAAYDSPRTAEVHPELRAALDAEPRAAAMFEVLTSTNRYAVLYPVQEAKRPETRARRIAAFVEMLAEGRTPHPQRAGHPWEAGPPGDPSASS